MKKTLAFLLYVLLLLGAAFFLPAFYRTDVRKSGISVAEYKGPSGTHYKFYSSHEGKLRFTLNRPDKKDTAVQMCVAGAFTLNGKPDGIYCVEGRVYNRDSVNRSLGGAIIINENSVQIIPTRKGAWFTKQVVDSLVKLKASFFQQIQMVMNGKAEDSKSPKQFQCRGIVVMKDGSVQIVESREEITLKIFADDMQAQGNVKDLLYTDMGGWDEGWYRNHKGAVITIGDNRTSTELQSNWAIFKK